MASQVVKIRELDQRLERVEKQVARLEREKKSRREGSPTVRQSSRTRTRVVVRRSRSEEVDEILRRAGLLHEPTERERQLVAEWQAVSLEERTRLVEEFRAMKFEKPLSDIIIENRR